MSDRLPNAAHAQIDPRKLRDYALNPEHEMGRYKAAFFAQMGYAADHWQRLEQDIREQHLAQPVEAGQPCPMAASIPSRRPCRGLVGRPAR